ncbi:uncharacterized protein N7484_008010 [Penicillium longicatenatum]|uniref:uncharacterized protein n=1 Tax=Penicillium longicatenatum TaxID=1561947 RepID=UPI002547DC9C|nr:uncharacterized protein N7484_008010 [Penicillium longicatenatum]KAJ5640148.1 hypothetical protein N7484_008010 [Penicillium longicatenatum]
MTTMENDKRLKLFIGLDFGTTFSGVAWALEGRKGDDVEVIQEWPGKGNSTSQKVPTLISYHNDGFQWGYQIDDMKTAIRGVKLLLHDGQPVRYVPAANSKRAINKLKKKPVDVASDYMKSIVSHAKVILDRRGMGVLLGTLDIQYNLTIPGVWSDKAKDLTTQAACFAGIPRNNLTLLSEPEAAAVYAIRAIQPNTMAKGDCFIVCDAGGGTVDLISYQITQTEPVRMKEVTEGSGEVCGSVILDGLFEDYLIKALGAKTYKGMSDATKRVAMQRWQNDIKPHYAGLEDEEGDLDLGYIIPIPGMPNGILYMENEHVKAIFDHVVARIEGLIASQKESIQKAGLSTKAIILVGGFGASEYVYKRVKGRFEGTDIMQPLNAWSAVVRGAVYRGLEGNQVGNRKARCHYGTCHHGHFSRLIHDDKDRVWSDVQEKWGIRFPRKVPLAFLSSGASPKGLQLK